MARWVAAGFTVFCVMAMGPMGVVGHAGQAKPAAANAAAKALKNPVADNAVSIEAGKAVYAKYCRSCHGAEGKGNKKLPLDGINKKLSTTQIRTWIASPAEMEAKLSKKPAVKMSSMMKTKLSDPDVDALVAYVQSLK